MHCYFVFYEGDPGTLDAFRAYYRENHAEILRRLPGLTHLLLHERATAPDPYPVNPSRIAWMAQMIFADEQALASALHSPERTLAREDFGRFPAFDAIVSHGAFASSETYAR